MERDVAQTTRAAGPPTDAPSQAPTSQSPPNTLVNRRQLFEIGQYQDHQVTALETVVKFSTERYTGGKASYYEVIEAQQQLCPTQLNLARTQRDRLLFIVTLYKSLGGWQDKIKREQHL
jgi:multidrug efflux system outer membrane protein